MTTDVKITKVEDTPPIDESPEFDPADAFARVKVDPGPTIDDDPPSDTARNKRRNKNRRRERDNEARKPVIEPEASPEAVMFESIDPEVAAEALMQGLDGIYGLLAMLRGYPSEVPMPDGSVKHIPDPLARLQTKRALMSVMRSSNIAMSPGAVLGFSGFMYIGLPILAFEAGKLITKQQKASG